MYPSHYQFLQKFNLISRFDADSNWWFFCSTCWYYVFFSLGKLLPFSFSELKTEYHLRMKNCNFEFFPIWNYSSSGTNQKVLWNSYACFQALKVDRQKYPFKSRRFFWWDRSVLWIFRKNRCPFSFCFFDRSVFPNLLYKWLFPPPSP